jgi:hypothetical protein
MRTGPDCPAGANEAAGHWDKIAIQSSDSLNIGRGGLARGRLWGLRMGMTLLGGAGTMFVAGVTLPLTRVPGR